MEYVVEKLTNLYSDEIISFKETLNSENLRVECSAVTKDPEALLSATSCEDCLFLYILIRHLKPTSILEIGTWVGSTLFSIISACEKNNKPYQIHTIDNNDALLLESSFLHSVIVHKGWSQDILKNINTQFDFVFADGNINFDTANLLENMITPDTFFITHDYVAPFDKGIEACFNMIKYTSLKQNILVNPSHKCNWIYKQKSYKNMHEKFSPEYVANNEFNLNNAHNDLGLNNAMAIICPSSLLEI